MRSHNLAPLKGRVYRQPVAPSAGAMSGSDSCLVKLRAALVAITVPLLVRASTFQ